MKKFPNIPKTWEELVKLREYLTDCDASFLRLPEDKLLYETYAKSISRQEMLNSIYREIGNRNIAILLNQFPHTNILKNLPNITNYCLWSKTGPLNRSQIEKIIDMRFKNPRTFYMERKVNHKSVPEIWHCHIYVENQNK
jgi:hypothetical protein